jgi:hypothetical protein
MMKEIILLAICTFWSMPGYADSLTITFSSGKTQRVDLQDAGDAVQSILIEARQQENGPAPGNTTKRVVYKKTDRDSGPELFAGKSKGLPEKRHGPRVKWGAPKTGE